MANSIWKGHIAFGMVSFPVKLCAAARTQTVSFHQLHKCDHSRVKQVLYCQAEDRPVVRDELIKGYEYEKDRYVVVEERDLQRIVPSTASAIEVLEFVPSTEVNPVYLDASYYVQPDVAEERPYALLLEALRRTNHVGLAQWTLHSREHMGVLGPGRSGLVLHTMYYSSEVRAVDEFRTDTTRVGEQELELATMLVRALAAPFEPVKYRDHYQENLHALLEAKIQGKEMEDRVCKPTLTPVVDSLEALKASLARKKRAPVTGLAGPPGPEKKRRSPATYILPPAEP